MGARMMSMRRTTLALAAPSLTGSGHPDDKLGWAIGAGFKLNTPFIGQGDYFQTQVNYTQGALRYVFQTTQPTGAINDSGNSAGFRPHQLMPSYSGVTLVQRGSCNRPRTDHGVERQRGLRALLEPALAHVAVWWLRGGQLRRRCPKHPAAALARSGVVDQRLRRRLADLVGRFAHPVERHQGLLHGSGRDVLQAAKRDRCGQPDAWCFGGIAKPWQLVPATDPDNWSFRFRVHRDFYP